MKKATVVRISLLMLLSAFAGFCVGWQIKHTSSQRDFAERTYRTYVRDGIICVGADKELWSQELRDELQQALSQPWPVLIPDDAWGAAYSVLRDQGQETWRYSEGMSDSRQDEMIRYLCFLIVRAASASGTHNLLAVNGSSSSGREEFKALLSYPKASASRNREMITMAASAAARSRYDQNRIYSFAYLAQMVDLDWARNIYQGCLHQAVYEIEDIAWLISYIEEAAQGKQGMLTTALESGPPAPPVRAGASQVIADFMQSEWSGSPKEATVQHWRAKLATTSSPTTAPSQ